MSLFASLTRMLHRSKSADPQALGAFLHRQGAFVAQKTVLDYCRVKAGRREKEMFADADFVAALEHCRWQVYLAALADVFGVAEAWLRPFAPGQERALAAALVALHDGALAQEVPPPGETEAVAAARLAFAGHLAALQLAPPQPANLLSLLAEAPLFATLPIHPDQRRGEAPAIRGALRFHVVSTQQELERSFDPAPLARALLDAA